MPSDYYLLMEGVNGESQAEGMANNIELETWGFEANSEPALGGTGLSAGKPQYEQFTCSFPLDKASFQLLKNLSKGTHIGSVKFAGRKTGGDSKPYTYLVVTLTK